MNKYLAIIDRKTIAQVILCFLVTYFCIEYNFSYNLNVTLFSIAVIFPLVFTIREAFKRRDHALRFLSLFKASLIAVYYCIESCNKLSDDKKAYVSESLEGISKQLFDVLKDGEKKDDIAHNCVNDLFNFVQSNSDSIPNRISLKIVRFLQDVHESIEASISIKTHGTPISLRAYCLVFVFVFPTVFIPVIVFNLTDTSQWLIYTIGLIHGFILIALFNVQADMEDPYDQVGLDDIKLEEFGFKKFDSAGVTQQDSQPN